MEAMENKKKFEARNPNFETISSGRNTKFETLAFRKFDHLNLGFVSSFDIRISDLSYSNQYL